MQEEKYGNRDRTYSAWHRRLSTRRFVGLERAQALAMIDLDAALYVEYEEGSKHPVALIETALDVGQAHKSATVTMRLAKLAGLPCYCVLYRAADSPNPADPEWPDIQSFRVKRLWPQPESTWRNVLPSEWAQALLNIRGWYAARLDAAANDTTY